MRLGQASKVSLYTGAHTTDTAVQALAIHMHTVERQTVIKGPKSQLTILVVPFEMRNCTVCKWPALAAFISGVRPPSDSWS